MKSIGINLDYRALLLVKGDSKMVCVNGNPLAIEHFPDGTLFLKGTPPAESARVTIDWRYEDEGELMAVYSITRHLQKFGYQHIDLYMPYVPNARMDRVKNPDDVFTLKWFSEIINALNFERVIVLDPHSFVSEALIDRIIVRPPKKYIEEAKLKIGSENLIMFYPDEGAMKRYSDMIGGKYVFGVKTRNWNTRQVTNLEIMGDRQIIEGSDILIADDICSRGSTAVRSAESLKELGARDIYLYVSHCEATILSGQVLTCGNIEKVFTTDSICRLVHPKIEIFRI